MPRSNLLARAAPDGPVLPICSGRGELCAPGRYGAATLCVLGISSPPPLLEGKSSRLFGGLMASFDFNEMREAVLRGIEVGISIGEFDHDWRAAAARGWVEAIGGNEYTQALARRLTGEAGGQTYERALEVATWHARTVE